MRSFFSFLLVMGLIGGAGYVVYNQFFQPRYMEVSGIVLEYEVGDSIDLSNAIIRYYEGADHEGYIEVIVTGDMISGFDTETPGTKVLVVRYEGLTEEFEYVVNAKPPQQDTSYIEVYGVKTTYELDDTLDLSNAYLRYYENNTTSVYAQVSIATSMVTGFNTQTVGNKTMTVTYMGKSKDVNYVVTVRTYDLSEAVSIFNSAYNNSLAQNRIEGVGYCEIITEQSSMYYVLDNMKMWIFNSASEETVYQWHTDEPLDSLNNKKSVKDQLSYDDLRDPIAAICFVSAQEIEQFTDIFENENREITILGEMNDGFIDVEIKIVNNLIVGISKNDIQFTFEYNEDANIIPQLPSNVIWNEN